MITQSLAQFRLEQLPKVHSSWPSPGIGEKKKFFNYSTFRHYSRSWHEIKPFTRKFDDIQLQWNKSPRSHGTIPNFPSPLAACGLLTDSNHLQRLSKYGMALLSSMEQLHKTQLHLFPSNSRP